MNELYFVLSLIVCFSALVIFNKLFKQYGVYAWIAIATIIANIEVTKCVRMFGMDGVTLGNVTFASIYLATDILNECYGFKESKRGVFIGLASAIAWIALIQIDLLFKPSAIDFVDGAMQTIFSITPRVCAASAFAFFLSNLADVFIYDKIKNAMNGKHMWVRNNVSTIICNCTENFVFVFLAFIGVYTVSECVEIAITTCIIETLVAFADTPFLYISKKLNGNKVVVMDGK